MAENWGSMYYAPEFWEYLNKLRKIYENLGFHLVATIQEDYRKTAFYQKKID